MLEMRLARNRATLHHQRENPSKEERTCLVCDYDTRESDIVVCPHKHEWCKGCFENCVRLSLREEIPFPPICCDSPFNFDAVKQFLPPEMIERYKEKEIEIETRTYCFEPRCSTVLRSQDIDCDIGTCPTCGKKMCIRCKTSAHDGDCPADEATKVVRELGKSLGWRDCEQCKHLVSMSTGCNHMP